MMRGTEEEGESIITMGAESPRMTVRGILVATADMDHTHVHTCANPPLSLYLI